MLRNISNSSEDPKILLLLAPDLSASKKFGGLNQIILETTVLPLIPPDFFSMTASSFLTILFSIPSSSRDYPLSVIP